MNLASARRSRTTFPVALLLGAALFFSGCKQTAPTPGVRNADGSITNADGSITYPAGVVPAAPVQAPTVNADGSTTNPDGSVTYPAGSARATKAQQSPEPTPAQRANPAPVVRSQPAPPPPPVLKVVNSGTEIPVTLTETLSASRNNVGDTFTGVLRQDITTASGQIVFKRGDEVAGIVSASKGKGRFKGSGDLAIELTRIGGARVSTTSYEAVSKGRGKRTAGFVGGGGGLGAIIGGLAGGGKGALIGGLAGAGAGTAGAAYTGNRDVVIPSESAITFTLTDSVSVR